MMPGKRNCKSIGFKIYEQKRLVLLNLNEAYELFRLKHPFTKIGRFLFCLLRPVWCVLADSSGTHNVCVCQINKNLILLPAALPINDNFRDIIDELVCEKGKRECHLKIYAKCPGQSEIVNVLTEKIIKQELTGDIEEEAEYQEEVRNLMEASVNYQQWTSTELS